MKKLSLALALILLTLALAACGEAEFRTDVAVPVLYKTVIAAVPSEDGYTTVSDSYINGSLWGTDYQTLLDNISEKAIVISANSAMNVDEIGIFRIKDGGDVKAATQIVKDYVKAQQLRHKSLLESYNPDELPKTENGTVTVCGQYILYTILDKGATSKARDAFTGALTVQD